MPRREPLSLRRLIIAQQPDRGICASGGAEEKKWTHAVGRLIIIWHQDHPLGEQEVSIWRLEEASVWVQGTRAACFHSLCLRVKGKGGNPGAGTVRVMSELVVLCKAAGLWSSQKSKRGFDNPCGVDWRTNADVEANGTAVASNSIRIIPAGIDWLIDTFCAHLGPIIDLEPSQKRLSCRSVCVPFNADSTV